MNVIVFKTIEHDVVQKPVPTLWHHALGFGSGNSRPKTHISGININVLHQIEWQLLLR